MNFAFLLAYPSHGDGYAFYLVIMSGLPELEVCASLLACSLCKFGLEQALLTERVVVVAT